MKSLVSLPVLLALTLPVASGCASLRSSLGGATAPREFVIESTWVRSTPQKDFLGYRRLNRMAPLVLETMVVQGNSIDGLVAYNRKNGNEIWRLNIENGVEGGAVESGGNLYFGASDGLFYCVKASDGAVLWTFPMRSETLAPPTIESGVVYAQNGADVVYALDAATGKQLWLYNRQVTGNFSIRATTRPVVAGESVYVGFSDGFIVSLKKRDGGLLWERKIGRAPRFRDVDATPVIDGDSLFVSSFDGTLYSLRAESGDINWQIEEGGYVPVTLGTERLADRLYYATATGKILILDKRSGKQISAIELKKGIPTQPVVFKNLLIYGESEGGLIAADAETGVPVGRFEPGRGLMARPTVIDQTGEAYIMSNNANIFALKMGYKRIADRLPWQKGI